MRRWVPLLACLSVLRIASAQPASFAVGELSPVATDLFARLPVATADVNGDGNHDIAIGAASGLTIYEGDGTGRLGPGQSFPIGASLGVELSDLNLDGAPDIAALDGSSIRVSFGMGNGDFGPATSIPLTTPVTTPDGLLVREVNGDGWPDLVSAPTGGLSVMLNLGGGSFAPPLFVVAGGPHVAIVSGDWNGDSVTDIALVEPSLEVFVLEGQGNGDFQPPVQLVLSEAAVGALSGDFTNDGVDDLAVSTVNALVLFPGSAVAGLGAPVVSLHGVGLATYLDLVALNLDPAGDLDIAIAAASTSPTTPTGPGKVFVLTGSGDGHFARSATYSVGEVSYFAGFGELTGDAYNDALAGVVTFGAGGYGESTFVSVVRANGSGGFDAPLVLDMAPVALVTDDFTGDGVLDLVAVTPNNGVDFPQNTVVHLFAGVGGGALAAPVTSSVEGFAPAANTAVSGDLDEDGIADLVIPRWGPGFFQVIEVWKGSTAGFIEPPASADPRLLDPGDVAGALVLPFPGPQFHPMSFDLATNQLVCRPPTIGATSLTAFPGPQWPLRLAMGDVNRDGHADVVASYVHMTTRDVVLAVLTGDGSGALGPPQEYLAFPFTGSISPEGCGLHEKPIPLDVELADFNRDGALDAVVLGSGPVWPGLETGSVAIVLNDGLGAFLGPSVTPLDLVAGSIAVADLDLDDLPDLVLGSGEITSSLPDVAGVVRTWLGNGDGTFDPSGEVAISSFVPAHIAPGDFNGDGAVDVAVGGSLHGFLFSSTGYGSAAMTLLL